LVVTKTFVGNIQRIPEIAVNNRTVVQPTTWYTCPAGKKALVTGTIRLDNYGAASEVYFRVNSVNLEVFNINDTVFNGTVYIQHQTYRTREIVCELEAGDTLNTTQSSGTNAEFNVALKILELPA
jgi:hypothetical protein